MSRLFPPCSSVSPVVKAVDLTRCTPEFEPDQSAIERPPFSDHVLSEENNNLQVSAGQYNVHFIVRDNLSGRVGSVRVPLNVAP